MQSSLIIDEARNKSREGEKQALDAENLVQSKECRSVSGISERGACRVLLEQQGGMSNSQTVVKANLTTTANEIEELSIEMETKEIQQQIDQSLQNILDMAFQDTVESQTKNEVSQNSISESILELLNEEDESGSEEKG